MLALEGERLVGIFSERDDARKVILKGKSSKETIVREITSSHVLYIRPEQTLEDCMVVESELARLASHARYSGSCRLQVACGDWNEADFVPLPSDAGLDFPSDWPSDAVESLPLSFLAPFPPPARA